MTSIIFGILWIVTIVGAGMYVKAKHKIESKSSYYEAFCELQDWAEIAVRWAQDRLGDQSGHERRLAAVNALTQIRNKMALDLTDEQIGMLISAAYTVMSSADASIEDPSICSLDIDLEEME